jgi:hypothetical protein
MSRLNPFVFSSLQDLEPVAENSGEKNCHGPCGINFELQCFENFDRGFKSLAIGANALCRMMAQPKNDQFRDDQETCSGAKFDVVDKPQYENDRY